MRDRFPICVPLVIYILFLTLALGLSEGNVGTAFRHRDGVSHFFIIFGIAGLMKFFGRLKLAQGQKYIELI